MKKYQLSLIFIVLGIISFGMYSLSGSFVTNDGMLIESFGYIPIGYLLVCLGGLIGCVTALKSLFTKRFP